MSRTNALSDAWVLARKDLLLFFRDRTAVALALALPLVLATVFGSAMKGMMGGGGGGGGGLPKVGLYVEDQDGSPESEALLLALEASDALRTERGEQARRRVAGGEVAAALVVPAGYGATLRTGQLPELELLRDPAQFIAQQAVSFALLPVVAEVSLQHLNSSAMGGVLESFEMPAAARAQAEQVMRASWDEMSALFAGLDAAGELEADAAPVSAVDADSDSGFDPMRDLPGLLGVRIEDVAGGEDEDGLPRSAGASHAVASMAVMMLMFSLVAAGGTLLEEQEEGTLQRLQLAPNAGRAVLVGKLIALSAIGLLQLALLYVYGWAAFGVPVFARPLALVLASLALVWAAVGLGLFFATACRTRKQVEGLSTLVILVMSAVGGAWFPREVTPDWFQSVGLLTITAHAMDAFHGLFWYGKGLWPTSELDGIARELGVLFAVGFALLALSARLYRRRYVDLA